MSFYGSINQERLPLNGTEVPTRKHSHKKFLAIGVSLFACVGMIATPSGTISTAPMMELLTTGGGLLTTDPTLNHNDDHHAAELNHNDDHHAAELNHNDDHHAAELNHNDDHHAAELNHNDDHHAAELNHNDDHHAAGLNHNDDHHVAKEEEERKAAKEEEERKAAKEEEERKAAKEDETPNTDASSGSEPTKCDPDGPYRGCQPDETFDAETTCEGHEIHGEHGELYCGQDACCRNGDNTTWVERHEAELAEAAARQKKHEQDMLCWMSWTEDMCAEHEHCKYEAPEYCEPKEPCWNHWHSQDGCVNSGCSWTLRNTTWNSQISVLDGNGNWTEKPAQIETWDHTGCECHEPDCEQMKCWDWSLHDTKCEERASAGVCEMKKMTWKHCVPKDEEAMYMDNEKLNELLAKQRQHWRS